MTTPYRRGWQPPPRRRPRWRLAADWRAAASWACLVHITLVALLVYACAHALAFWVGWTTGATVALVGLYVRPEDSDEDDDASP